MFAVFRGKKINYTVAGEGPALLLLHGYMEMGTMWNAFAANDANAFRCIIPDLPGHGLSETIKPALTIEDMAEAMFAVLANEGVREVFICGHSLGGYVALEMAAQQPERVKGIVLLHSTTAADSEIKKKERDRVIKVLEFSAPGFIREAIPNLFANDLREEYRKQIEILVNEAMQHPVEGLIAVTRAMRDRPDKQTWLSETTIPVHFIIGKKDNIISMQMYEKQIAAGGHVSHFISERAGHMGFIEDEEAVFSSIISFLKSISNK